MSNVVNIEIVPSTDTVRVGAGRVEVSLEAVEIHVDSGAGVGPRGPAGPAGPQGPPGSASASYVHDQLVPASVWNVVHNLGYRPGGILIYDSAGDQTSGEVEHLTVNALTVTFTASFGGVAYLS